MIYEWLSRTEDVEESRKDGGGVCGDVGTVYLGDLSVKFTANHCVQ
jgi:hypothetical protein